MQIFHESLRAIGKQKELHSSMPLIERIPYLSLDLISDDAKTFYEIGAQSIHYESQSATVLSIISRSTQGRYRSQHSAVFERCRSTATSDELWNSRVRNILTEHNVWYQLCVVH